MWVDAWGEAVHTDALRDTLEQLRRAAGAPCSPSVLADGDRQGCWTCADPEDAAGATGRRARRDRPAHDAARRRRRARARARAWARRLAELELGVDAARSAAASRAAPPGRRRTRRGSPIRGARPRRHRPRRPAPCCSTYLRRGARRRWLDARLGARRRPTRSRSRTWRPTSATCPRGATAEVVVRCALDGAGRDGRAHARDDRDGRAGRSWSAPGATVVAAGEDGAPRPLTEPRARSAAAMSARGPRQAEVARDRRPDLGAGALERHLRVAGEHADAVAVDERQQAVGHRADVAVAQLAARDAVGDRLRRTTRAGARRGARPSGRSAGSRALRSHSSTHSTQSSRSAPSVRQALVDHRRQPLRGRRAARPRARRGARSPARS